MRRAIAAAFGAVAWTMAVAGEPPPFPGCDVDREVATCLEDSGNSYDMLACYEPATAKLQRALDAHLARLRSDNAETRPALASSIEAAQKAWLAARDADCGAVSAEWEGGSLRRGQVAACRYEHVLARRRWLWRWHEWGGDGASECATQPPQVGQLQLPDLQQQLKRPAGPAAENRSPCARGGSCSS
jgi:uncharacterized protein YecT (DUF1311 family)